MGIFSEPADYSLLEVAMYIPRTDRFIEAEMRSLSLTQLLIGLGKVRGEVVLYTDDYPRMGCAVALSLRPAQIYADALAYSNRVEALFALPDPGAFFYLNHWAGLPDYSVVENFYNQTQKTTKFWSIYTPDVDLLTTTSDEVVFFDQGWTDFYDYRDVYDEASLSESLVFIIDVGRLDVDFERVEVGDDLYLYSNRPLNALTFPWS